ncbi:hypothetical protein [Ornithinimicrobium panacihumi]|uniref:hypothetical protein n=1 Tax=Ornithinimicrobium panacihumi TaxID=2008449 RepID=UPI003F89EEC6
MSEKQVVGCRRCGRALSREVYPLPEMPQPELRAGGEGYDPTVPVGYVAVDPVGIGRDATGATVGTVGCLVTHIDDGLDLVPHEDAARHHGCCADDGLDGPNLRCPGCRSEIATLRDDCWSPQELRFEPDVAALMPLSKTWT